VKFEIGHVLFIDFVGYSKSFIHEQSEQIQMLKEIVRGAEQFRVAAEEGKLLSLPAADGRAREGSEKPNMNSRSSVVICASKSSAGRNNAVNHVSHPSNIKLEIGNVVFVRRSRQKNRLERVALS
jgi:hypothetical protein